MKRIIKRVDRRKEERYANAGDAWALDAAWNNML